MTLLDDIEQAEETTTIGKGCGLCEYILAQEDKETQARLRSAAGGTIGRDKMIAILKKHDTGIGRRTVERHREEGHTP
jgi:hypothetical protein